MKDFVYEYAAQYVNHMTKGVALWVLYYFNTEEYDRTLPHRIEHGEAMVRPDLAGHSRRFAGVVYRDTAFLCRLYGEDIVETRKIALEMYQKCAYGTAAGDRLLADAKELWRNDEQNSVEKGIR